MNPWRWVRSRRWWVQLLLAGGVLPIVLVTLYVAGRSIQYAAAERDGGVYVPSTANVVLRARGLEAQLRRLRDSTAWHAFERRILRDPVLRRQINGLLQANGAPTLDDLDDSRKPFAKNQERLIDAIGDDLIGALQVRDSLPKASWCGIVRLRWLHYLAAPFARLALRSEELDGETCLVIRDGGQEIRIVIIGSLAIAANDKALLSQALRRQGREEASDRPIVARAVFENSPALFEVRKAVRDSGVMPFVDWSTARGLKLSADVQDATASLDLLLDKAEPLHSTPPPLELRGWAPLNTSGLLLTNTGGADLMRWLSDLVLSAGPRDFTAQTIQQALKALEDGGLYSHLLPQLNDGMAFVTGLEEREGRSYTAFALLLPSKDPEAAVEALNRMVRKIAGAWGDSKYFTSIPVGDVVLNSWSWPEGLQINDLLSPTYGAVKGMIVLGNNAAFTEAVVKTAAQGGGFEETSDYRKLRTRLKEAGIGADPALAGGFLLPPLLRASLDGMLTPIAKQLVYASLNGPALRQEVEAELRRQGTPQEPEIVKAYNEAIDRKIEEQEAALRRCVEPLNAVKWGAFEAKAGEKGITLKAAAELR